MVISTVDVRSRVLVAARAEFAERGLAGARIDRIAVEASASKERLYAYFGDKLTLFRAVLDLNATEFHTAVPLDPTDVPGFVGAVFDHALKFPAPLRMLTWARMEGIGYHLAEGTAGRAKVEALGEAQHTGIIDASWQPDDLLALLFAIAHAWVQNPLTPEQQVTSTADHRRAAVEAAARLVAVPAAGGV